MMNLRLFAPEGDDSCGDGGLTLSQFFESDFKRLWCKPRMLSKLTVEEYANAISWWKSLTGDPPLAEIDDDTAAEFISELSEATWRRGLAGEYRKHSIGNIVKILKSIQKVLNFAGPRFPNKANKSNRGLISMPPYLPLPASDREAPGGDFTIEEVQAIYRSAAQARMPLWSEDSKWDLSRSIEPAAWWRALVVVLCDTGFRIKATLNLDWSDIRGDMVTSLARNSKGRKGHRQYLSERARLHLEAIAPETAEGESRSGIVFPWPHHRRMLDTVFDEILAAGEIQRQRGVKFQGFRKFHATQLFDRSETSDGMTLAQQSAGHTSSRVTQGHYVNGDAQRRAIAAAIEGLPGVFSYYC